MSLKIRTVCVGACLALCGCSEDRHAAADGAPPGLDARAGAIDAALTLCGNGVLDGDESCDDGNNRDGDFCAPDCSVRGLHCSAPTVSDDGEIPLAGSTEFIALCDGLVLHTDSDGVVELDTRTGEVSRTFEAESPVRMALDARRAFLYTTVFRESRLQRTDMVTGEIVDIGISAPATSLALGDNGILFARVESDQLTSGSAIAVVDGPSAVVLDSVDGPFAELLSYDPVGKQLFVATRSASPGTLYRYAFDADPVRLRLVQTREDAGSNGKELEVSRDGAHLAFVAGGGNGFGYTVVDYNPQNIDMMSGQWSIGPYPKSGNFSGDSSLFLAAGASDLSLHDTTSHDELARFDLEIPYGCRAPSRARIAPDFGLVYASSGCRDADARLYWFVVP